VFVFTGLLAWSFFAASVQAASGALVNNSHLLGKVYFPRLIMPLASLGAPLLDCAVSSTLLIALMVRYRICPGWGLCLLPAVAVVVLAAAMGVGVLLSALTVQYRDFRHVVPFMLQVWFFMTPVIVPTSIVPARLHGWLYLNPMSGPIEALRAMVLGGPINYIGFGVSALVAVGLLVVGLLYFTAAEKRFADIV
jgi:lipopolysaccharide transport system permease protein